MDDSKPIVFDTLFELEQGATMLLKPARYRITCYGFCFAMSVCPDGDIAISYNKIPKTPEVRMTITAPSTPPFWIFKLNAHGESHAYSIYAKGNRIEMFLSDEKIPHNQLGLADMKFSNLVPLDTLYLNQMEGLGAFEELTFAPQLIGESATAKRPRTAGKNSSRKKRR